jgi:hypothetical protein
MKCKHHNWATTTAIVACITATSVLGSGVSAQASAPTAQGPAAVQADHTSVRSKVLSISESPRAAREASISTETRSWGTIVRTAINALKKVPALWNKVVDGVKKAYATFRTKVWPAIKGVVGAISTAITAWDIWKSFN